MRIGVGRFWSFLHKWGPAPSSNCGCRVHEQIADHIIFASHRTHQASKGRRGLPIFDNHTRCWLTNITATSDETRTMKTTTKQERNFVRGAAKACESCCINCFPHKNYNVKVVSSFLQFYSVWLAAAVWNRLLVGA